MGIRFFIINMELYAIYMRHRIVLNFREEN